MFVWPQSPSLTVERQLAARGSDVLEHFHAEHGAVQVQHQFACPERLVAELLANGGQQVLVV